MNNTATVQTPDVKKEYSIRGYLGNIEVFMSEYDEDDCLINSGRVAHVACNGDSPMWKLDDTDLQEEDAMTTGYDLEYYLESLGDTDIDRWIEEYGHGML